MIAIFALVHRDGRNVRDDHPGMTGVAVVVDDVSDEDEMIDRVQNGPPWGLGTTVPQVWTPKSAGTPEV